MATTQTADQAAELQAFDDARDAYLGAMTQVPESALAYLKPGDDYSLGGLSVHVNFVFEHYLGVLRALADGDFAECHPEDPPGLEERALARARSALGAAEVAAELAATRRLHDEVAAMLHRLGPEWTRQAAVWYPGATEPYPTGGADVLGWLAGHYREHVPHIAELRAAAAPALAVVDAFNAAFARGDVDAVMALMTDDCVFENTFPPPDGERHVGQAAVRRFWESFFASTESPRFETEEAFAAGDRVVGRWLFRWGSGGSGGHVRGVDVFKVRDGKVAEKLSYVKG